jgi:hypothetical protein
MLQTQTPVEGHPASFMSTTILSVTIAGSTVNLNGKPFAAMFAIAGTWYCQELDRPSVVYSGATKELACDRLLQCYYFGRAI